MQKFNPFTSRLDFTQKDPSVFSAVAFVAATPVAINALVADKVITALVGAQTITYTNLTNGLELNFSIEKGDGSTYTITLPANTVILSGTTEATASLVATTVDLSGANGSKYLFRVKNVNGVLFTTILKMATENTASSVRNVYCSGAQILWSSISGAAINNDVTLLSITIPIGTMGLNTLMEINVMYSGTADTNSKTYKIKDGSTLLTSIFSNSATNLLLTKTIQIVNKNSLANQIISITNNTGGASPFTLDFSVARTFLITLNINNIASAGSGLEHISIRTQG